MKKIEKLKILSVTDYLFFNIRIPHNYCGSFLTECGIRFASAGVGGVMSAKQPEKLGLDSLGWHLEIMISKNQTEAFLSFLNTFCDDKGLDFDKLDFVG